MATFNFPASPVLNEPYTLNDVTWKWNGVGWVRCPDVPVSDFAKTLIDDGNNGEDRTTLGLGTAATTNVTGTVALGGTSAMSSDWAYDHLADWHSPENDIGDPGGLGFGVGIYPGTVPGGFSVMEGTRDFASDNL